MEFVEMIGITKHGELMVLDEDSSITGHQFIGVIVTDPRELEKNFANIANHFYCKDSQQLDKLVLKALHKDQNPHHLSSEQS